MQYNLALHSQTESNTDVGNVDVDTYDLTEILRITTASAIAIYDDDILCLDCDLGGNVKINEIRYYFSSPSASDTVASGIEMYYKDESFDTYISLSVFVGSTYYYATITSGTSAPRYIRLKHTVSGTAVSGTVAGFEVTNYEDWVDFGDDGTKESENVELAVFYDTEDIKEIYIYNNSTTKASAFSLLEPQYTDVDDFLSISTSAEGPWVPPRQESNEIAGSTTWGYGNMYYTELNSNRLVLEPTVTSGTYTTRVFDTIDTQKFTFLNLNADYSSVTEATVVNEDFLGSVANRWNDVGTGGINYNSGWLTLESDASAVETTDTFYLGYYWEVKYKLRVTAGVDANTFFRLPHSYSEDGTVGSNDIYFNILAYSFFGNNWILSFYVDNVLKWSNSTQVEYDKFRNDWGWVKIKRELNTIYFKYWSDPDPEPAWIWSGVINTATVATEGKISIYHGTDWTSDTYYDDITLRTNIGSTGKISKIAVDETDTQDTMEIRSSNQRPLDYIVYKKMWYADGTAYIKDYWLYDDTEKDMYDVLGETSAVDYEDTWDSRARIHVDLNTRRTASIFRWEHVHAFVGNYVVLSISEADNSLAASLALVADNDSSSLDVYSLAMDANMGTWLYAYADINADAFNDGTGFYLKRHDTDVGAATITETYSLFDEDGFIYDMSIVYNTGHLWYTAPENNNLVKLGTDGTVLLTYAFTDEIKGCAATPTGDCWVVRGDTLHLISVDGDHETEISPSTTPISLSRVALDGDGSEALWISDSHYIRRMYLDGRINFSVDVEVSPAELVPYETGIAVYCIDGSWKFISKDSQRIIKTIANTDSINFNIGVDAASVSSAVHQAEFPIPGDNTWDLLSWRKFVVDYYNLPVDMYNQLRLTLRRDDTFEKSPELTALYLGESILTEDIAAQSYGTIYLKSDIGAQDISGSFDSSLKTWWFVSL